MCDCSKFEQSSSDLALSFGSSSLKAKFVCETRFANPKTIYQVARRLPDYLETSRSFTVEGKSRKLSWGNLFIIILHSSPNSGSLVFVSPPSLILTAQLLFRSTVCSKGWSALLFAGFVFARFSMLSLTQWVNNVDPTILGFRNTSPGFEPYNKSKYKYNVFSTFQLEIC